jgi:hypothetical protein
VAVEEVLVRLDGPAGVARETRKLPLVAALIDPDGCRCVPKVVESQLRWQSRMENRWLVVAAVQVVVADRSAPGAVKQNPSSEGYWATWSASTSTSARGTGTSRRRRVLVDSVTRRSRTSLCDSATDSRLRRKSIRATLSADSSARAQCRVIVPR